MKSPLEAIKTRLRSTSSVPLEKTGDETSIKQLHLISDEEITMDEICIPSCLNPGADAEIIRCSSCMIKVHASCVNETATYGAWRCTKCRKMCENLQILLNDMSYTCKEIHDL